MVLRSGVPQDTELLEAWRRGDREAGNLLVERYFVPVYRFFRNKVTGDLDDLVQNTFLRCSQAKDDIRQHSSFRPYLFRVARNVLIDDSSFGLVDDPDLQGILRHEPGHALVVASM